LHDVLMMVHGMRIMQQLGQMSLSLLMMWNFYINIPTRFVPMIIRDTSQIGLMRLNLPRACLLGLPIPGCRRNCKVLRGADGKIHLIYNDETDIYYSYSTDNGVSFADWEVIPKHEFPAVLIDISRSLTRYRFFIIIY